MHQAPSAKEDRIAVLRQIAASCVKVAHLSVRDWCCFAACLELQSRSLASCMFDNDAGHEL